MPVIRDASDKVMLVLNGDTMAFKSDPYAMAGNDYVEAIWTITNFNKAGAGTLTARLTVEGSNDGATFFPTTLTDSKISLPANPVEVAGFVRTAYIRFSYELELTGGSTGDLGYVAFDLHVNLLKSGS